MCVMCCSHSFDFVLDLNLRVVAWIFDSAPRFSPLLILLLSRRCGCLPFYSVATCGLVPRFPSRARAAFLPFGKSTLCYGVASLQAGAHPTLACQTRG
jgi:hypothetical protein